MSKTTKHQATHDYLEGKDVGKSIWGILRFMICMTSSQWFMIKQIWEKRLCIFIGVGRIEHDDRRESVNLGKKGLAEEALKYGLITEII